VSIILIAFFFHSVNGDKQLFFHFFFIGSFGIIAAGNKKRKAKV
jgi:hypothetical protein